MSTGHDDAHGVEHGNDHKAEEQPALRVTNERLSDKEDAEDRDEESMKHIEEDSRAS